MKPLEGRAPCSPHPPGTHPLLIRPSVRSSPRDHGTRGWPLRLFAREMQASNWVFIVSARPLPPVAPATVALPAMAAPGRSLPHWPLPRVSSCSPGASMPAPALSARPALPIPWGMADSFCFLTAFKACLQFSPLPCCSPWGGIPGCATSGGDRAMWSPPCSAPCFVGSLALGVRCPTGLALSPHFPCDVCSPPLTLGRAKLRTRDPHVAAGGCVVPLARRLCRGGCAPRTSAGTSPSRSSQPPF